MSDTAAARRTLLRHSKRVTEIVETFARYGYAAWVSDGVPEQFRGVASRIAEPDLLAMSDGERLRRICLDLGTTFIKIGQLLSTRSDIVGDEIAAELASLQSDVPPDPPDVVEATVETELGRPVEEVFAEFDAEPLGSASIAQVHLARLYDGTVVVLKIQHAGIQELIETDLDIIEALAVLAQAHDPELALYRPVTIVDQMRRSLLAEVDFRLEASNLARFRMNFAEEPDVVIPQPYPEQSTGRVLTMSRMEGTPLSDAIHDLGDQAEAFVRRGADIYIEMIFRDGLFHADPHPGNIFVVDGNRVGLLDFGKVGRVNQDLRGAIDDLVIAALNKDVDAIVDGILQLCGTPSSLDRSSLSADVEDWIDRYASVGAGNIDMGGAAKAADDILRRYRLVMPRDVALLIRTLVQLQGLLVETGVDITVREMLEPHASMIAAQRFSPQRILREVRRTVHDYERMIETFPSEVTSILDGIRTGEIDVPLNLRGLDRNVNRLIYASISAALFLGSSRMWAAKVPPLVGDVSVPGAVGTIMATIFASRLLRASQRAGGIG